MLVSTLLINLVDRREIADQREAGPERPHRPQSRICALDAQLAASSGALSSFIRALRPPSTQFSIHMKICVVGPFAAGVAAEQPAGDGRDEEKGVGRDDQQRGEVDDILRRTPS